MRPFGALDGLRVGCVQYLNAKPLIVPYDGPVIFEHPARLADMLAAGEMDVALVPVYEALRQPGFPIVDGVAIASCGEVFSVFLAYRGELSGIRTVVMDPASRTSNFLARVLLGEFHGIEPVFEAQAGDVKAINDLGGEEGRAVLLIGNQAIRFREATLDEEVKYLDMGQDWMAQTGLPFVFAVWQMRPEVANPEEVAKALRAIKKAGMRRIWEIAGQQKDFTRGFADMYLKDHIKFDLEDEEKEGLAQFWALLEKRGLIGAPEGRLRFV